VVRDFLAAVEHGEFVALLQAPEEQQVQRIAPELDSSILLMTHQTYEEKVLRRDQLQHELATVIPELIAKARALGDLSENADYHAARERQGLAAAEVRALESVIECTRLIEKLDIDEEVASAGTEVRLQDPSGHERVFWILGQDDGYHGPEVINYRAELGQALIGHRVGDEVTVELDGERVTCRLVAIRRRMPDVLAELERYRAHRGQFTD
jgi:transcription elongation factor GreA